MRVTESSWTLAKKKGRWPITWGYTHEAKTGDLENQSIDNELPDSWIKMLKKDKKKTQFENILKMQKSLNDHMIHKRCDQPMFYVTKKYFARTQDRKWSNKSTKRIAKWQKEYEFV